MVGSEKNAEIAVFAKTHKRSETSNKKRGAGAIAADKAKANKKHVSSNLFTRDFDSTQYEATRQLLLQLELHVPSCKWICCKHAKLKTFACNVAYKCGSNHISSSSAHNQSSVQYIYCESVCAKLRSRMLGLLFKQNPWCKKLISICWVLIIFVQCNQRLRARHISALMSNKNKPRQINT